jgi:hypothetical protein
MTKPEMTSIPATAACAGCRLWLSVFVILSSFVIRHSSFSAPTAEPPRETKFVEVQPGMAVGQPESDEARAALAIRPEKWKTAETDNFIIHYRRVTEAQKVAREVEFNLWFVAQSLGAKPESYARKSHVFVFEDEKEWNAFLASVNAPSWFGSFANGDDLYLSVRGPNGAGFDSHTLAHETTHAVVARICPGERWPVWLNEGFAEYMGGAAVAARKHETVKRHERNLFEADMPLDELFALKKYPEPAEVPHLYQSSEKFVRFLFTELPKERFVKFAGAVASGQPPKEAFVAVYGDKVKDWETFLKLYAKFTK